MTGTEQTPDPCKLFRGDRQQAWVEQMQEPEGLHPSDGETGRWSGKTWARIAAVTDQLIDAGFEVWEAPLGPRGGRRWRLDASDFDSVRGEVHQLIRPFFYCLAEKEREAAREALRNDAALRARTSRIVRLIGASLGSQAALLKACLESTDASVEVLESLADAGRLVQQAALIQALGQLADLPADQREVAVALLRDAAPRICSSAWTAAEAISELIEAAKQVA